MIPPAHTRIANLPDSDFTPLDPQAYSKAELETVLARI